MIKSSDSQAKILDRPQASLAYIRERLEYVEKNVYAILEIADRACGTYGEKEEGKLTAAPNGMLDQVECDVSRLIEMTSLALSRLSRIA